MTGRPAAAALAAAALAALLSAGCAGSVGPTGGDGPGMLAPPEGLGLEQVIRPDFSAMGESAARQMRERYDTLARTVGDGSATAAELAAAYGGMGDLLLAARELETAEAYYRNAQTLAPGEWRWAHLLGHLYRNQGPLDEAVTFLEHAAEIAPRAVATLVRLGEVYLALGRPEAAAPRFEQALAVDRGSAAAWYGAGRAALARRDDEVAVNALEEALALAPEANGIHYPLAMAYRRLGETERARAHMARQGEIEPRPDDPVLRELEQRFESALLLDFRGGEALAAGNWAAAADFFDRALALDPDRANLRHRLGTALWRMGDARGAETAFERIIEVTPEYSEAHFNLAMILAQTDRLGAAIERLRTVLARKPGYLGARVALARLLAMDGRPEEAQAEYAAALALAPLDATATLGAAMTQGLLERYADAEARLREGQRAFPDDRRFTRALARLRAAAADPGVRDARRALALAESLLEQRQDSRDETLAVGETYAMALAAAGQYPAAAAVQQDVRSTAVQAGSAEAVVRRLADNLRRYERGEPAVQPWAADELP
ncbi:MAG: tetratricopeptide repeat protein [Acidobacteria bacterium]|nr:tetratricopeptide repeat protein [Acidobacteriota bacterium]